MKESKRSAALYFLLGVMIAGFGAQYLTACGDRDGDNVGTSTESDTDSDGDTDSDTDQDSDTDTDSDTNTIPDIDTDVEGDTQVLFFEDFADFVDVWNKHPDWTVLDEDGLTDGEYFPPDTGNIWVNPSWRISPSWRCAMSNSRFTSPGQADNWMILPQIQLPDGMPYVKWAAQSVSNSGSRKEDYEILVSTTDTEPSSFTSVLTIEQEGYTETDRAVNLRDYAGQNVYIAFRHISYDQYLLRINYIEVGTSAIRDMEMTSMNVDDVAVVPSGQEIRGVVSNKSAATITSFDINWSVNGGSVNTDSKTGLNLPPFTGEYNFLHSAELDVAAVEDYELTVWVSNPNGDTDENSQNDTIVTNISGLSQAPEKFVLMEEGTSTT